ncbi:MAG: nicotinate phosphoribosyltransferase [Chloroflexi bacterium]|nr:nicotinate phosphoribosyltransferase [Chloroflexota bacterium]
MFTDLYELTMAQAYFQHGMFAPATFSLFVRRLPPNRGYMVAAGLEDVLRFLEGLRFTSGDIDYLHGTGLFAGDFLDYLSKLRFTGDVWAIPEGRLFFANEPLVEVTAPVIEAQLVETFIINQVNLQSLIATKAARTVWAAKGRSVVEFGLRRTHGMDAGMKAARVAYMVGCDATSNVLAGRRYGIPISGTMAHSFVTSFDREIDSFRAFARSFPKNTVLLIDTYDTVEGARKAVTVAREMEALGHRLAGVRIDSGDLKALAFEVRWVLDEAGLPYVRILASGGLDEYQVAEVVEAGSPCDAFGVGTQMGVSGDAPSTDMAYKLVKYGGRPVLKLSTGKATLPDEKQVLRYREGRKLHHDVIALRQEAQDDGRAEDLLDRVMHDGRIQGRLPSLAEMRDRFREEFACLDEGCKRLAGPDTYPVELSRPLRDLAARIQQQLSSEEQGTG